MIYNEHKQLFFLCAFSVTQCTHLAEDAVQSAFSNILSANGTPENLKSYVYRSVRNSAINMAKIRSRTDNVRTGLMFDPAPSPEETLECNEFIQRVNDGFLILSQEQRETIMLHLYENLSFRKIAELLDCSINTVASRYRRGVDKLKQHVEE